MTAKNLAIMLPKNANRIVAITPDNNVYGIAGVAYASIIVDKRSDLKDNDICIMLCPFQPEKTE